jgi:hypothetical protein
MIIYESTKQGFLVSVLKDTLADEIAANYRKRIGRPIEKEYTAWIDSMLYLEKVLHTDEIPDNAGVAIEFRIPSTTKRVNFREHLLFIPTQSPPLASPYCPSTCSAI